MKLCGGKRRRSRSVRGGLKLGGEQPAGGDQQ